MAGVIRISGKRSKFRNKRCRADGFTFDSLKERERYYVLRAMAEAGIITNLKVHPRFPLVCFSLIGGEERHELGCYVPDFEYRVDGRPVIEDVKGGKKKGTRTDLYRWKKRHFEAQYRLTITEV